MRRPIRANTVAGILAAVCLAMQTQSAAEEKEETAPPAKTASFRQVQMHVWISETTEQGLRDLGANLNYTRFVRGRENRTHSVQQIRTDVFDERDPQFGATLPPPDPNRFTPPLRPDQNPTMADNRNTFADGIQTQSGAGLTFSLINSSQGTIDGVFRAIEQNADVDLISKPELLVIENMTAIIQAGGRVPFQHIEYNKQGVGRLDVAFKDIGVNMKVTPTIRPDNLIQINIEQLDVTDVVRFDNVRGLDLPVISKRSQTGVVLVPNGQTLVIGGLSSRVSRKTERRVPLLGRIPLLGIPFRSRQSEVSSSHLMIFVAPTIVDLRDMAPTAIDALHFWEQGGWKNAERIQHEIQALEEEF